MGAFGKSYKIVDYFSTHRGSIGQKPSFRGRSTPPRAGLVRERFGGRVFL